MATWLTCRPVRWGMGIGTRRELLRQVRALVSVPPSSITSPGLPAPRRSQSPFRVDKHALDARLARLVATAAPDLLAVKGIGTETAGALLVAAGDNPDRLRS